MISVKLKLIETAGSPVTLTDEKKSHLGFLLFTLVGSEDVFSHCDGEITWETDKVVVIMLPGIYPLKANISAFAYRVVSALWKHSVHYFKLLDASFKLCPGDRVVEFLPYIKSFFLMMLLISKNIIKMNILKNTFAQYLSG